VKHLVTHRSLRLLLIAFGTVCFVYAFIKLGRWVGYKRTDRVIGVEYVAYKDQGRIRYDTNRIRMNGTNPILRVGFVRLSGSVGGVVQPQLPANAKPGDHVTVLYREENGLDAGAAVVYSFDTVWREPVRAAVFGAFLIGLWLWLRSEQGHRLRARHENAV
jgi:hypothetical protein